MEKTANPPDLSRQQNAIRAKFGLGGWTQTPEGNMRAGNLMLIFVRDRVRLQERNPQGWLLLIESSVEKLYQKLKS